MRTLFLIILLGFIKLVFCCPLTNVSEVDYCPVNLFRRKRANLEYTRWRANTETTPEFIVKVLDDEVTTPITNQIIAVNIMPLTKRGEKIIVGGAMVPSPTTLSMLEPREYTRFVPPTTTAASNIGGNQYLAPAPTTILDSSSEQIPPIKPRVNEAPIGIHYGPGLNALRDESPPAGPHFLAQAAGGGVARQYAPIAPVAFTRHSSLYSTPPNINDDEVKDPTHSTYVPEIVIPTRTLDDVLHNFEEVVSKMYITRTTSDLAPSRSTPHGSLSTSFDEEIDIVGTTHGNFEEHIRKEIEKEIRQSLESQIFDKESEISYNNIFDTDEYKDIIKKGEGDSVFNYEEKHIRKHMEDIDKENDPAEAFHNDLERDRENQTNVEYRIFPDTEGEQKPVNFTGSEKDLVELSAEKTSDQKNDRSKRRPVCNMIKLRELNFNSPRTLPEIVSQLKQWAEDSPVAKWVDITKGNYTIMENPIYMMIIDDPSNGQVASAKQTVMVVAGIQGRDHHAVAAAMYILYQLIERTEAHAELLSKFRFWIIPVFNPDGYDYSKTFPHRREWTKNLRQRWDTCNGRDSCKACENYGLRCTIQTCYGVNLDRNFEYQWIPAEELRAEHPCGPLYAGERQLSEAETQALTHYLHDQRTSLSTFVAFKEGEVLGIMYPYSHTKKKRAFDNVYRQRASRAAAAAYSISGRPYVTGQTSEFLPLYAGGIEDWVDGHLGIDNTYTVMMSRPNDCYHAKLITERVVHEAYAALDTLLLQSLEPKNAPVITLAQANNAQEKIYPLFTTIMLTSFVALLCS